MYQGLRVGLGMACRNQSANSAPQKEYVPPPSPQKLNGRAGSPRTSVVRDWRIKRLHWTSPLQWRGQYQIHPHPFLHAVGRDGRREGGCVLGTTTHIERWHAFGGAQSAPLFLISAELITDVSPAPYSHCAPKFLACTRGHFSNESINPFLFLLPHSHLTRQTPYARSSKVGRYYVALHCRRVVANTTSTFYTPTNMHEGLVQAASLPQFAEPIGALFLFPFFFPRIGRSSCEVMVNSGPGLLGRAICNYVCLSFPIRL